MEHLVQVPQYPLYKSKAQSVAAGATEDIVFNIPDGQSWRLKSVTSTLGANTTINSIKIDGHETNQTGANVDLESIFGDLPVGTETVTVNVTNANTAAESSTIELFGLFI